MEPMKIHFQNILLCIECICQAKGHSQEKYKESKEFGKYALEGIHKITKVAPLRKIEEKDKDICQTNLQKANKFPKWKV